METIIVYIDDADYTLQLLAPMLPESADTPTRWILVGCAPRVTRHISKFVTQSARAGWRGSWADKVFSRVVPYLQNANKPFDNVITQLAPPQQDLCELTKTLTRQYNARHVLDARRPKLGQDLQPVTASQVQEKNRITGYAAALAGAGLLVGFD